MSRTTTCIFCPGRSRSQNTSTGLGWHWPEGLTPDDLIIGMLKSWLAINPRCQSQRCFIILFTLNQVKLDKHGLYDKSFCAFPLCMWWWWWCWWCLWRCGPASVISILWALSCVLTVVRVRLWHTTTISDSSQPTREIGEWWNSAGMLEIVGEGGERRVRYSDVQEWETVL